MAPGPFHSLWQMHALTNTPTPSHASDDAQHRLRADCRPPFAKLPSTANNLFASTTQSLCHLGPKMRKESRSPLPASPGRSSTPGGKEGTEGVVCASLKGHLDVATERVSSVTTCTPHDSDRSNQNPAERGSPSSSEKDPGGDRNLHKRS